MPAFEVILRDASNTRGGDVAVVATDAEAAAKIARLQAQAQSSVPFEPLTEVVSVRPM